MAETLVLDDLSRPFPETPLGTRWGLVTDTVMGGVSQGRLTREAVAGRSALRLRGDVRLENSGGFVQMALDLAPGGGVLDARGWTGLALEVCGNGAAYGAHLRTDTVTRPWQSWRHPFPTAPQWHSLRLPFAAFAAHRIEGALQPGRLRRLGLVAIGRAFEADLALADLRLYR